MASKAIKKYAKLPLAEFDAMQGEIDILWAQLTVAKQSRADHDNRCEMSGTRLLPPIRIRRRTIHSSETAKAMQAALNRLQLTAGQDTVYRYANRNREAAPDTSACFESPDLVSRMETFTGDGFVSFTRTMELTKSIENASLPAGLFQIDSDWTEARADAKALLDALLKTHGK